MNIHKKNTVDPEPIEPIKEENPTEWWMPLCPEEELNNVEFSGKLMLLFSILAECEACGDKLLVFSQSLFSLDVIEHFLAMIDENTQSPNPEAKLGGFTGNWARGLDYFRLDGSTNIETRNANCINFNSEDNPQARLATGIRKIIDSNFFFVLNLHIRPIYLKIKIKCVFPI